MLYWIHKKKKDYEEQKRKKIVLERQIYSNVNKKNISINEWFECYRYIPRTN